MKKCDKSEIGLLIGKDVKRLINESKIFKKAIILEYAESRKDLDKSIFGITVTLMQHWCLVKYCTETNRVQTKQHWKSEVFNYIYRIASTKIKPSNNRDIVAKMIEKRWFEMEELNSDTEKVVAFIENKFNEENINLTVEELTHYANEFQGAMNDIIQQMAYGDKNSINAYIESI